MEGKQKPINSTKIPPNSVGQDPPTAKPEITAPLAMAELEIMKLENAKSVANKNPGVRNIALLFLAILGINLSSQIITLFVTSSFSDTQTSFLSAFVSSYGFFGIVLLVVQAAAIFTLLFTRNISRAKTIILIAGISFGAALLKGIFSFQIGPGIITDIAILVVNILIFQKILKVYLEL